MKKVKCVFLLGLILFLNLLSLNSSFSSQSTNSLESASERAEDPLKVGTTSLGYNLDPALVPGIWDQASLDIIDQVWEGLYAHNLDDPRLRIIPRLAADCGSWNENSTVFNVTLRSGITFHNGDPFNASCVVSSFERLYQLFVYEDAQVSGLYYPHDFKVRELYFPYGFNGTKEGYNDEASRCGYVIKSVEALDNYKIRFTLNYPYMPFQSLLCFSASYIMHPDTPKNTYLNFGNINNGTAIGTGPYLCTEYTHDNCTFKYWDDYYRGTPAIKKIIFVRYPSSTSIYQALLDGELDIPRGYDVDFMDDFEEAENIYIDPYLENQHISLIYMNNVRINRIFRQAINYAIDYDKILNEIYVNFYNREASRMTSIVPPGILYHKECEVPIFNITKARQILIEAGYAESYGLDEYSTNDDWKDVTESNYPLLTIKYLYHVGSQYLKKLSILIEDNLKDIGIRVEIKYWSMATSYIPYLDNYDMYPLSWLSNYNDPSQIINFLMSNTSSYNYAQANDTWLQHAMEEALTIINEDDRKALYYDIQDYIATDLMPYAFIACRLTRNVRANYVITQPNPMNKFYVFPFSWHGVNTTFNDPYLELWCNGGSPPVVEFWPEPREHISGYPMILISIFSLVIIPFWIQKNKKKLGK